MRPSWYLHVIPFHFLLALIASTALAQTPVPGQNVNMVSGTQYPGGDPFLQRQNEPTIAVSTRNALHLMGAANDYRSVDVPFPDVSPDENTACNASSPCAEPWVGVFKSFDGGQTWQSALLPGYPQDDSNSPHEGKNSPLHSFTTASDPVVRAGPAGIFYYSGIAFNRGTNQGVVFVARFMDLNNKENGDVTARPPRDPIRYVDTATVAKGTSTQFLDKPWIAVDVARNNATCSIDVPQDGTTVHQRVPAGNVYVVYTAVTNPAPGVFNSQLYLTHSLDCGATWSAPVLISRGYAKSQGATIQIDPETGIVYVAWRVFASGSQHDAIAIAASIDGGRSVTPGFPVVSLPAFNQNNPTGPSFFDQGTTNSSFRTNAYPALAVGDSGSAFLPGPLYLAWSQRTSLASGDARIMMLAIPGNLMISSSGITLPTPFPVDNGPLTDQFGLPLKDDVGDLLTRGHQFMPQMTVNGGKLSVLYYDQREDHTVGFFTPLFPADSLGRFYDETREREGELSSNPGAVFTPFLSDYGLTQRRHTITVRLAQANVSWGVPVFKYADVTQYTMGTLGTETGVIGHLQEMQVNPPNLPLFQQGTAPFIGDYMDIAGLSFLSPSATGGSWRFNTKASGNPVQYATWTTNQDVRAPADGDWTHYTPVGVTSGRDSIYKPGTPVPDCKPGQAGMRNQNIYESRITQGLLLSSPQTSKPLSTGLQRAFVVTAQNFTSLERSFHLTISAPAGVYASFSPVSNPPPKNPAAPLTTLDITVPPHAGIARSVFAFLTTSTNAAASIVVNGVEITTPAGGITSQPCSSCTLVPNGLTSFVTLNPDGTVPPLVNPDGATDNISTVEIYTSTLSTPNPSNPNPSNPNQSNPNPSNPNPSNPNPSNPNPSNPNPSNPGLANPNPSNPNPSNPNPSNTTPATSASANNALLNPNPSNPNPSNPNPSNPNLSDDPVSDATYSVTNTGDTSASYHVELVGQDPGHGLQLIVSKFYETPNVSSNADGTPGCELVTQNQMTVQANVVNPVINPNPSNGSLSDGITNGLNSNPTFQLAPGQKAYITLRGYKVDPDPTVWAGMLSGTAPVVVSQAANTNTNTRGISVPGGLFILTATLPPGIFGQPYSTTLQAIGGTGLYTWSGAAPAGLTLNSNGTLSGTLTAVGTFPFMVMVSAGGSASKMLSLTVGQASTTTMLMASPPSPVYGQTLTLTATVAPQFTGTPTGNVDFWALQYLSGGLGKGLLGSALLISGQANLSIAAPPPGTWSFEADYNGNSNFTASTGSTPPLTVQPTTDLAFVQPPLDTGQSLTISPPVTVRATDHITAALLPGLAISLTLGPGSPTGAHLKGTTSALTDVNGVASFAGLSIDLRGTYTLEASAVSALSATSASFNVTQLLFVADEVNNRVLIYNAPFATGQSATAALGQTTFATSAHPDPPTAASMSVPWGLAVDSAGNLYVADWGNNRVLQFQPPFTTGMAATLAVGQPSDATNLTANSSGSTATALTAPPGAAIDSAGNLWVADFGNSRVLKYPAPITAGEAATVALGQTSTGASAGCNQGGTPSASTLCSPISLAFDSFGSLWVADSYNNRVLMYPQANLVTGGAATVELGQPASTAFTSADPNNGGVSATSLSRPTELAFDISGYLWVADSENNRVLMYPPTNLVTGGAATLELGQPSGATAFTSNAGNNGGIGASTLAYPVGLAFDSSGRIIVGDTDNNRTLVFAPPFGNGMSATLVLGQADFTTRTENTGGESATTQDSPLGLATSLLLPGMPTTTTSLSCPVFGPVVQCTATVTGARPGTPTGTVTFTDGSTVLGTVPLNGSGQASWSGSVGVGLQCVTATYSGDTNYSGSISAAFCSYIPF